MLPKMIVLVLATCVMITLVMADGWLVWIPAAGAFWMLRLMQRTLG